MDAASLAIDVADGSLEGLFMLGRYLKSAALAATISLAGMASADAAVYSLGGFSGLLPTNTSFSRTFTAASSGTGLLSFIIDGFGTIDGQNASEDDLSVAINGMTIFSGTFNLGGGGSNAVYIGDPSTTATTSSVTPGNGGILNVLTPVTILGGLNTVTFTYASLSGPGFSGFQGTSDEGWALSSGSVNTVAAAVPEPSTWAMLLAGFGGLALMLRRRARTVRG